jgi:hypothetical protein
MSLCAHQHHQQRHPTTPSHTHLLLLRGRRCVQRRNRGSGPACYTSAIIAAPSHAHRVCREAIGSQAQSNWLPGAKHRPPLEEVALSLCQPGLITRSVPRPRQLPHHCQPLHCGTLIVALNKNASLSLPHILFLTFVPPPPHIICIASCRIQYYSLHSTVSCSAP